MPSDRIIELYDRRAVEWDHDRARSLHERGWLDRFLTYVGRPGTVLDLGCGGGEPIARYLLGQGLKLVGVDSSRGMIEMCRDRFREGEWVVGDMRQLALGRTFEGILAWDSFFHLSPVDQRAMFHRFSEHAAPDAALMFTSGPAQGEVVGSYRGEPLYHASLDSNEYVDLLTASGFRVRDHVVEDPLCGGHTVWLATYEQA